MKAVLISIQPKWCELIASGKKTVEVRKTKPKIDVPFKCYIYCTQGGDWLTSVNGKVQKPNHMVLDLVLDNKIEELNGKVIGEFVCDRIDVYPYDCHIGYPTPQYEGDDSFCDCGEGYWITYKEIEDSCLTQDELMDYGRGETLYGWHISNLVIYEQPKELSEFYHYCGDNPNCEGCEAHYYSNTECGKEDYCCSPMEGCKPIKRPFQSWGYVYEVDT